MEKDNTFSHRPQAQSQRTAYHLPTMNEGNNRVQATARGFVRPNGLPSPSRSAAAGAPAVSLGRPLSPIFRHLFASNPRVAAKLSFARGTL